MVWTFDSETDPFKKRRIPKPFLWGAYDGETYYEFEKTNDFVKFISEIDDIFYAHNGGGFDFMFLLDHLEEFHELTVINGKLATFRLGLAELRDSYLIVPTALGNIEKTKIDYDIFEAEERIKPKNKKAISEYLKDDCVSLHKIVSTFRDEYGDKLTIASTALAYFEKLRKIKIVQTDAEFYNKFAPYYYGGRVECFEKGVVEKPFDVVDIKSAYPEAMLFTHAYGVDEKFSTATSIPQDTELLKRCFIQLSCASHGAFPFREKDGLIFPNDDITRIYSVTGWEYVAAFECNKIADVTIIRVLVPSEFLDFKDYINHFYQMKADSEKRKDKIYYWFSKIFMNSLYGKFAADPSKYKEHTVCTHEMIDAAIQEGYNYNGDLGQWALISQPIDEEAQRYYCLATAASITGFVRAKLFRAVCNSFNPLYCDTDSIAAEVANVEFGKALGQWEYEGRFDRAFIGGKKMYLFERDFGKNKKATKGVRITDDQVKAVARGDVVTFEPEVPKFSLKRSIKILDAEANTEDNLDKVFQKRRVRIT